MIKEFEAKYKGKKYTKTPSEAPRMKKVDLVLV